MTVTPDDLLTETRERFIRDVLMENTNDLRLQAAFMAGVHFLGMASQQAKDPLFKALISTNDKQLNELLNTNAFTGAEKDHI